MRSRRWPPRSPRSTLPRRPAPRSRHTRTRSDSGLAGTRTSGTPALSPAACSAPRTSRCWPTSARPSSARTRRWSPHASGRGASARGTATGARAWGGCLACQAGPVRPRQTADPPIVTRHVITAGAHCAPPDNKPTPEELASCRGWLDATYELMNPRGVIALGQIAFRAAIDQAKRQGWFAGSLPKFGHGALVKLSEERWILASYHPSQQNTFTGKLTEPMFDSIFARARGLLAASPALLAAR